MLLLPLFALILSGCAGYQLGSSLSEDIQTVSLSVVNETDEPSIEVAVMKALRAELQMDGRLQVRSPGEADAVLRVTLNNYDLDAIAFDRVRGSLAREYRVTISGEAVLYDTDTEEVILEVPDVDGEAEFAYGSDLTTAKLGALPEAAADMARRVVSMTVMSW